MLEFKQLRYFIAVAESSSFSKAAQKLYISQPALSQQISKMEEELGIKLIQRNTRSIQLTAAGKDLYQRAIALLRDMENMIHSVVKTDAQGYLSQNVRICLEDEVFSYAKTGAYEFLAQIRKRFPVSQIDCLPSKSDCVHRQLIDGNADMAILYLSAETPTPPGLVEYCFHRGRLALAVPADWEFGYGSPEFIKAVNSATLYYPQNRRYWHGIINSVLANNNAHPKSVSLDSYEAAQNFVICGNGIYFAPEVQLEQLGNPYIKAIPIEDPSAEYRLSVLFSSKFQFNAFKEQLQVLQDLNDPAEQGRSGVLS